MPRFLFLVNMRPERFQKIIQYISKNMYLMGLYSGLELWLLQKWIQITSHIQACLRWLYGFIDVHKSTMHVELLLTCIFLVTLYDVCTIIMQEQMENLAEVLILVHYKVSKQVMT